MTPLTPDAVMAQIAAALPEDCRPNVIVIGSLAAGYHFFSGDGQLRIPAMPVPESGGSRYLIPVSCRYNNPVDAGTSRAGGKAVSARWVASVKSREIGLVKACGFSSSNRL